MVANRRRRCGICPSGISEKAETVIRCVCHQCGYRATTQTDSPCRTKVCPRCGGEMGRDS